jgi:DNA-binding transcriptional LysR family regulator
MDRRPPGGLLDLNLVRAFACVHETGSFSRAAERLGVPRSSVSRAVAALEDALGVVLFLRTTRQVTSTAEGKALHDRLAFSLKEIESALADTPARDETPSGILRVTTTVDIGSTLLAEAVTRFTARYPRVQVEVYLTMAVVDLIERGFDLAVRVAAPRLRGANLVAKKIGEMRVQLYASPAYLSRHEAIRVPSDLGDHDWIGFARGPVALSSGSAELELGVRQRVVCDDMYFVREVLRQGGGVGALPSFLADADVARGTLVRVLPRWASSSGTAYLVHPARRHVPPRVTAFREILLETLRQRPFSPG